MKYIAIFDDDMLCDFRRDDNGLTLVLDDSHGLSQVPRGKVLIYRTGILRHLWTTSNTNGLRNYGILTPTKRVPKVDTYL